VLLITARVCVMSVFSEVESQLWIGFIKALFHIPVHQHEYPKMFWFRTLVTIFPSFYQAKLHFVANGHSHMGNGQVAIPPMLKGKLCQILKLSQWPLLAICLVSKIWL